jgi:mannose-6-phosphate isomerase-like protein (cupin superfamily)|tara:strand:- start:450 stop:833 length:384 start_codon:yes stop_codon:yes gene_type:complete
MNEPIEINISKNSDKKVERPWGTYEIITKGNGFQVKRLIINPDSRLSLQWHRHRDETWVIVRGVAEIEVNKNKKNLGRGENVFVARTITHRIKNISVVEPLEIIEVQTGDYLGEDDIERLEDDYGRI